MKFYSDSVNCVWLPDDRNHNFDFSSYQKERKILRTLIDECINQYDPFLLLNSFCASDYARKICQGNHNGYFYGEGKFINDLKGMNALVSRKFDWDVIIFHWIIDLYLTARYELGLTYYEIATKYPVEDVYSKFNPLHETSELNALSKMHFKEKPLAGCMINDKYYLFVDQIPDDKKYLLNKKNSAVYLQTYFCANSYFFSNLKDIYLNEILVKCSDTEFYKLSDCLLQRRLQFDELVKVLLDVFINCDSLKQSLLSFCGKFVYCNSDSLYGIGMNFSDCKRINVMQWKGQNLLGYALQEVYNKLKES